MKVENVMSKITFCWLITLWALVVPAASIPVFQADFDGTPVPAKGKCTVNGPVKYIDGINGKAIVLADANIGYSLSQKIMEKEGTVTFWIKPLNWTWGKNNFIHFFSAGDSERENNFLLYKYMMTPNKELGLLWLVRQSTGHETYANISTNKWKSDKWYFLAATWSKQTQLIGIYVDGRLEASCKLTEDVTPIHFPANFTVNPPAFSPSDRKNETAYDLLRIYDHALSENEIAMLYQENAQENTKLSFKSLSPSFFNLPYLHNKPLIDGNFNETEWSDAARLTGFSMVGTARIPNDIYTNIYAGCDNERLYIAYISIIPGATQLINRAQKRDGEVYLDDCVELMLRPNHLKNSGYYQSIFNLNPAIYDNFCGDKKWNANWEIKSGIYEGRWITELAVPFKDFDSKFQNQAEWQINFTRDFRESPFLKKYPFPEGVLFTSWTPVSDNFFTEFGKMRLTQSDCFPRFFLDYEALFNRKLEMKLEVKNPGPNHVPVCFKVELLDPQNKVLDVKNSTVDIKPGVSHFFEYRNPMNGINAAVAKVTAQESGNKLIFSQDLPLVFKNELNILQTTNISQEKLDLEINCASNSVIARATAVTGRLLDKSGKNFAETTFVGMPSAKGSFNLKGIAPGDYRIELVFCDSNGKELLIHTISYNHIGQPRWLIEKPGTDIGVVYPYTPMKYVDNAIRVWGREYKIGNTLLPIQLLSQNKRLFADLPSFIATVNNKRYAVNNFKFTLTKNTDAEIKMGFTATAGPLKLQGTLTTEFDGMMWYEFNLDPGQTPLQISELIIEMPLTLGTGELFTAHFFGRENLTGKLKMPLSLKRYPSIWVGNADVGLAFFTESFQFWRNTDPNKTYRIEHRENADYWTVNLIDQPVTLNVSPTFHYEFGLQATPVKAIPSQFRSWRVFAHRPYNIMHPWQIDKSVKKYPGSGGFFTPVFTSMEDFRREQKNWHDKGVLFSVYLNPTLTSTDSTEYSIFRNEWLNPYNVYPECPNSSFTDYTVYAVNELIKNGLQSVYVDSCGAINCYNPGHGCGYRDDKGETGLTYPIRGMRNYLKRIYSLLHQPGRDQSANFLWAHMSARTCAPFIAFVDFQCSGEELENKLVNESNYLVLYPLDEYQVYFMNNIGTVAMLLPGFERTGPKEARYNKNFNEQVILLALLHDNMLWPDCMDDGFANKIYKILDDFGYRDEKLRFLSYQKQHVVVSPDADIHISVYARRDKVLAVVGNWQPKDRSIRLEIDVAALGLKPELKIRELLSNKQVDAKNPILKINSRSLLLLEISN